MSDKEYTKDPAIGYVRTYKDKKTKKERKYLRVMLDTEVINGLDSPDGKLYLAGFKVDKKKSKKSPDYVFKLSQGAGKSDQDSADEDVPF